MLDPVDPPRLTGEGTVWLQEPTYRCYVEILHPGIFMPEETTRDLFEPTLDAALPVAADSNIGTGLAYCFTIHQSMKGFVHDEEGKITDLTLKHDSPRYYIGGRVYDLAALENWVNLNDPDRGSILVSNVRSNSNMEPPMGIHCRSHNWQPIMQGDMVINGEFFIGADSVPLPVLTKDQAAERQAAISDRRTMQEPAPLTKVSRYEYDGGERWSLDAGGWGCSAPVVPHGPEPKVGDLVTVYGRIGHVIEGIDINGEPLFFHTKAEMEAEREASLAKMQAEKEDRFTKSRAKLDADYDTLPEPLKKRVTRFRTGNQRFRVEFEAYEMAGLLGALELADKCAEPKFGALLKLAGIKVPNDEVKRRPSSSWTEDDGVTDWKNTSENRWLAVAALSTKINGYDLSFERENLPALWAADSGNLHGYAVRVAHAIIDWRGGDDNAREWLEKSHGAMTPLVGCDDYGCTHEPEPEAVLSDGLTPRG